MVSVSRQEDYKTKGVSHAALAKDGKSGCETKVYSNETTDTGFFFF